MKNYKYRLINYILAGLSMLFCALSLASNALAFNLSAETIMQSRGQSEFVPNGLTNNDWEQVTRQIDSIYGQKAYLKASNPAAGDNFGYSVAISGDTLVVGAYNAETVGTDPIVENAGSVFIFVHKSDTWVLQDQLIASNPDQYDKFGWSVAIDDDTIVVGAPGEKSVCGPADNSASSAGAAYVFERNGTLWAQQAYLKAETPASDDNFGCSVAIDNRTIVVGAYRDDLIIETIPTANAGAAYVFARGSTSWALQGVLVASNAEANDYFGYSVDIDGNQILVGAWGENGNGSGGKSDNSINDAGAAYFYWRNISDNTWWEKTYLKASNPGDNDYFGRSVAISGETLVVGADGEDGNGTNGENDNSEHFAGAAYVFKHIGSSWSQQAYLKADNGEGSDQFGRSVDISGDTILVGAPGEASNGSGVDDNSEPAAGASYIFVNSATIWKQQSYIKACNPDENDYFGFSVALDKKTLVIGAYSEDSNGENPENNDFLNAGAAYVFRSFSFYLPVIMK